MLEDENSQLDKTKFLQKEVAESPVHRLDNGI
jgi:hypothetical protein